MAVPEHWKREVALERAVRALLKAGRRAVVAQERYDYWTQFGTNSRRAQTAERRLDLARAALDRAEELADEALHFV